MGGTEQRFATIDEIFSAAVELGRDERPLFLDRTCGGDGDLRRAVERLLAADERGTFLEPPAGRPPAGWEALGEEEDAAPEPGFRVGRIRLLDLLGRGGMGAVYVGFDEGLGRRVAVKVLRHGLHDAELRARSRHEARLLSRLNHPNICQIYDLVEGEDRDYLVLELIEGRTLRQLGRVDRRQALSIAERIAAALAAAHARGIVHRDLKPENVMVVTAGGSASGVKVLDFGVGRRMEVEADDGAALHLAGTPRYMSPEQARGEPATAASDLYSLGLLLRELVTGEPAYEPGLSPAELWARVAEARPARVRGVAGELGALIERLLSGVPAARPTGLDTAERLRWILGAPRRRLVRGLAATAVALLAIFAATMGFLGREARRQARLATAQRLTAQSSLHLRDKLDLALLLALEGHRTADIVETRSALLDALEASPRLAAYLHGHRLYVSAVAWSGDGATLASVGTFDGEVRLWDGATGTPRAAFATAQEGVLNLAWSRDDRTLATAGMDGTVKLWAVPEGTLLTELRGHEKHVWSVAWSGDGEWLASGSEDRTVRLWEARSGACRAVLRGHRGAVIAVAWSPDARWLASASGDGTVRLWDPRSGAPAGAPLAGGGGPVTSLAWSADGRRLAASSRDATVHLWDPFRGVPAAPPLVAGDEPVETLAWSHANGLLAAGSNGGEIRLWDPQAGRPRGAPLVGHGGGITDLAWSPDGTVLVSAARDRSLALWSLAESGRTGPLEGHRGAVFQLAVSPDGRTLASASWDQTVRLWDVASGRPLCPPLEGHTGAVFDLAWSPNGRYLASGGADWTVRLWDARACRAHGEPFTGHQGVVRAVSWSADGSTVASASWDGTVGLWRPADGAWRQLTGHTGRVTEVKWSADGRLLASAGDDGAVLLWSAAGEPRGELARLGAPVRGLAWHGGLLAVAAGPAVRLWDVAGGELRAVLAAGDPGKSMAWRGDGKLLAAAGARIHLWDVERGTLLARFSSHELGVLSVAWSADGRLLYSGGMDGAIRIREVVRDPAAWRERACRRAGRNLTAEEWARYLGPGVPRRPTCPSFPLD